MIYDIIVATTLNRANKFEAAHLLVEFTEFALSISLEILSSTSTGADSQQRNNQLYCGYCNTDCKTPAGLVVHCEQNHHKYAVFADSGRDVLWQFEPPPPNMKKDEISQAQHE